MKVTTADERMKEIRKKLKRIKKLESEVAELVNELRDYCEEGDRVRTEHPRLLQGAKLKLTIIRRTFTREFFKVREVA